MHRIVRWTLPVALCGAAMLALSRALPRDGGPARDAAEATEGAEAAEPSAPFVVHEWGTFLSVAGSDGVTIGGMVDSEETLPVFVEEFHNPDSWKRAMFRQKMETPVTYFYTEKPMRVNVRVDMPEGILTHWYPVAARIGPEDRSASRGGFLDWGTFDILPETAGEEAFELPEVAPSDPWRFARETDAAFVRTLAADPARPEGDHDYERFLFYRGLGTFELPLSVRSKEPNAPDRANGSLRLELENRSGDAIRGVVLVEVDADVEGDTDDRGPALRFARLGEIGPRSRVEVNATAELSARPMRNDGVTAVRSALEEELVAAGLYPKEARAMVHTWEKSYFGTGGLRVLYILPRDTADRVIPLRVTPRPEEIVRVMVGRVEVLTPDREREIERWLADAAERGLDGDQALAEATERFGRFAEPFLRRARELVRGTAREAATAELAAAVLSRLGASFSTSGD